jgi:transposase
MQYRYEVLEPLLIPYIREVSLQRPHDPDNLDVPGPIFQQDNASSHISHWTMELLEKEGIKMLEHPGNSPDMSAIEKAWMPMRISITNVWNRPHTLEWTERAWYAEWEALEQDTIRGWISEMVETNQRILDDGRGQSFSWIAGKLIELS